MGNNDSKSLQLAKQFLGKEVEVVIDRPLSSRHPKHDFVYEVNYGYVEGVKAPDGEDLDVYYLGVDKAVEKGRGKCLAVVHRNNDDDDKLVVVIDGFDPSNDEIEKLVNFQEKWFDHEIVRSN